MRIINQLYSLSFSEEGAAEFDDAVRDQEPGANPEAALEYGKFSPALYRQRYDYALDVICTPMWIQGMVRIVDFGCAECKFLRTLKTLPRAREIVGVDIDEPLIDYYGQCLEPLIADHLCRRQTPLKFITMRGSVAEFDHRLFDVDAVTAIEL